MPPEIAASMHFLLIHSPLVTRDTWIALVPCLEAAGFQATVVTLDNNKAQDTTLFQGHLAAIDAALTSMANKRIIGVAHSGAGNLLALIDPERLEGHIFLDAVFPIEQASRFELFDDPATVRSWREIAKQHGGVLPRSMLIRFGERIRDDDARLFADGIVDVPIELYEEQIPVHRHWPRSKHGLYVQWTENYSADAARAEKAGFEVRRDTATHFKMLNQPHGVARELVRFAREQSVS